MAQLDLVANREALFDTFPPASFDMVVSNDFLLQDPKLGFPGLTGLYLALDLVRPGGSLLCCNSSVIVSPSIFRGYVGAMAAERRRDGMPLGWPLFGEGRQLQLDIDLFWGRDVNKWLASRGGREDPSALMKLDKGLDVDGQLPQWFHRFSRNKET